SPLAISIPGRSGLPFTVSGYRRLDELSEMRTAVVTFVYNEAVYLPIWRGYYGEIFGEQNLFVIDHSSSDGSTNRLGVVNKLWLHRDELDEHKRCVFMSSFATALLEYFDTVIYTDCDELLVPDLR